MNVYVTLTELKEYLGSGLVPLQESSEESSLMRFCVEASRVFDKYVSNGVVPGRKFYPTIETRVYNHPTSANGWGPNDSTGRLLATTRPSASILYLDQDLVEISTLTTQNGSVTIASGDMLLSHGGNHNETPYDQIELDPNGNTTVFNYVNTPFKANSVAGTWCFHDDWANAWRNTGDTVQDAGGINNTVTTITVLDADGQDSWGLDYRFKKGGLYKIESEMVWVTGVNITNNTLTVIRGVNGSTAAAHANGVSIREFQPVGAIKNAMKVLATKLYRRKDTLDDDNRDRTVVTPHGTILSAKALPSEVKTMLEQFVLESL